MKRQSTLTSSVRGAANPPSYDSCSGLEGRRHATARKPRRPLIAERVQTRSADKTSTADRFQGLLLAVCVALLVCASTGCETFDQAVKTGTDILVQQGSISSNEATAIVTSAGAVSKALASITPEQEHYIGRTVGATVLTRYRAYDNDEVNQYLNALGQTLAALSDRPATFGGYHFLALNTDEVNAFSAPGGLIFVSRGMLSLCRRESDVAAVLAHEIGHVQGKHGLKAISRDRSVSAFLVTGTEMLKLENPNMGELTDAFGGVVNGLSDVLFVRGYGRALETEADKTAVAILKRAGYDPSALADVLGRLETSLNPGRSDFGKTHPNPAKRIQSVQRAIGNYEPTATVTARESRFGALAKQI